MINFLDFEIIYFIPLLVVQLDLVMVHIFRHESDEKEGYASNDFFIMRKVRPYTVIAMFKCIIHNST